MNSTPKPSEFNDNHDISEKDWSDLADSAERVSSLAHDESYCQFIEVNAISRSTSYASGHEFKPIVIDNLRDHPDLSFLSASRHPVASGVDIKMENMIGHKNFTVNVEIDSKQVYISGDDTDATVSVENSNNIPPQMRKLSVENVSQLLMMIASCYLDSKDHEIANMMESYSLADSDIDKLESVIFNLGNIVGESSRTTSAIFYDDISAIIARLEEEETPSETVVRNQLISGEVTALFTDENCLSARESNHPEIPSHEISGTGFSDITDSQLFAIKALERQRIDGLANFSYGKGKNGTHDESRHYALTCRRFLAIYDKLTS